MVRLLSELEAGERVRGVVRECEECLSRFLGRSDARFCCNACRVRASRREVDDAVG